MARILVIDDEAPLRALLRKVLEGVGHEVDEASDGARGIAACRQRPADVVLCDLFMLGMDGLETIPVLRREFPDAVVVAMSGGSTRAAVDCLPMARALGAAHALPKPFDSRTLLAVIDEACGARRSVADAS